MKKQLLILYIALLFLVINPQLIFAQSATNSAASRQATREATKEQQQTTRLGNLQMRADTEIDRRTTSLTMLITKIGSLKRISTDQKTAFTTQIQTEITNLGTLKTKIDADTDLTTARTDTQSIVASYRIYALFMPKIQILSASDIILDITNAVGSAEAQLQTKITEAKTAGKDVTSLETAVADIQTKVTDAKTQAENAENSVLPLTPDGYPGNKTSLQSARAMLKTARQDLENVRLDVTTIRTGLLGTTKPTGSASVSAF